MRRYDLENYEDSLSIMNAAPDGDWVDYDDAIEAIAEAQREGWEQAKKEAKELVEQRRFAFDPLASIADAIAAMEYKKEMK